MSFVQNIIMLPLILEFLVITCSTCIKITATAEWEQSRCVNASARGGVGGAGGVGGVGVVGGVGGVGGAGGVEHD